MEEVYQKRGAGSHGKFRSGRATTGVGPLPDVYTADVVYIMETRVKVAKWGNSLAVRIPRDVVEALGLAEGSEIDLVPMPPHLGIVRPMTRGEAINGLRKFRGTMPDDFKFDRDELYRDG